MTDEAASFSADDVSIDNASRAIKFRMNWSEEAVGLINAYVGIEARRLRELQALVADRIDQDATDVSIDFATGTICGVLSDAERAARYAIRQKMVAKGWEDPGWGR